MVEKFANDALDQNRSLQHGSNIERNNEIVCNTHVHLLILNFELVCQRSSLHFISNNFGHFCQNDEGLSNLFGLDWRNKVDVVCVETESEDRIHSCVKEGVLEFILDAELRANRLCYVLCDLVMAQFECDFSQIALNLVKR